jgi:predicted RNA-binding Zn-ribbon protein involved in translation (DUF1610 family)
MKIKEEMLKEIRAWLRSEVAKGKEVTMHECTACKEESIHICKDDWYDKRLWTCYNCGTSTLF